MSDVSNGMTKKHTLVAHDGKFHADDVLAIAVLSLVLGEDNISIVRSRDREVIANADFVVDVGQVYDSARNRFDHHQTGGAGMRENGIPYASFGLVWKHFGGQLCGSQSVADEVESVMVIPIDAADNGVATVARTIEGVSPYDFHDAIDIFNPHVSESLTHDEQFLKVVDMGKRVIEREIIKARLRQQDDQEVRRLYENAEDKRIVVFEKPRNTRFLNSVPEPLFYVSPSATSGKWVAHAIRIDHEFFEYRKYFPKAWAGKTNEELVAISGVSDAEFCHAHLFIAVAKSREGALKLARLALEA